LQDQIAPKDHNPQDSNTPQDLENGPGERGYPRDPNSGPEGLLVLPGEAKPLVLFRHKCLHDPDTRQGFLQDGVELGIPLLDQQAPVTDLVAESGDRNEEQREDQETEEGELPLEEKEQGAEAQDVEGLPKGLAEGNGNRLPQEVYVHHEA